MCFSLYIYEWGMMGSQTLWVSVMLRSKHQWSPSLFCGATTGYIYKHRRNCYSHRQLLERISRTGVLYMMNRSHLCPGCTTFSDICNLTLSYINHTHLNDFIIHLLGYLQPHAILYRYLISTTHISMVSSFIFRDICNPTLYYIDHTPL